MTKNIVSEELLNSALPEKWKHFFVYKHDGSLRDGAKFHNLSPRPSNKLFDKYKRPRLSYFENEDKASRGIRNAISPGKFLNKFFSDELGEYPKGKLDELVEAWNDKFSGEYGENAKLKFTQSPDEIEYVYTNGPVSCMSNPIESFDTDGIHPSRALASPDIAVAYVDFLGRIKARCIVWPDKKIFFAKKIYGNEKCLRTLLEKEGYVAGTSTDFLGARLSVIPQGDNFIMPYLDFAESIEYDGKDWFVVVEENYDGENSIRPHSRNGIVSFGEFTKCAVTGVGHRLEELTYLDTYGIYVSDIALEENYFWCEGCEDYYEISDMREVDGSFYSIHYLENNKSLFFQCEITKEWHSHENHEAE